MDKRRGSVAEIWRVVMSVEWKPVDLERVEWKSFDSDVIERVRKITDEETLIGSVVDVLDSIVLSEIIHKSRLLMQSADDSTEAHTLSFVDIFHEVCAGIRSRS